MKPYRIVLMFLGIAGLIWGGGPLARAELVVVSTVEALMATSGPGQPDGLSVLIKDGVYGIPRPILIDGSRVSYKGASGDRNKVVIRGQGVTGSVGNVFSITGSRVYIQHLSLGEVAHHGIQVHGEEKAERIILRDLRLFDIREQMLKGSYDQNRPDNHADYGMVENCLFEFTTGFAHQSYTGGIDVHHGVNWVVKNNIFKNIRTQGRGLTEGAVHFWNNSYNTIISGNTILNCDRGITLGLDKTPHVRGTILANRIHTVKDTGIYLCNASEVDVRDNIVFIDSGYPNAIEFRFKQTRDNRITGNHTNRKIRSRNGGRASVFGNVVDRNRTWTVDLSGNTLR